MFSGLKKNKYVLIGTNFLLFLIIEIETAST